mmetsp:Transcript_6727/g.9769  ORF Transcript_6727/g.9769 Transcript_6727/m.9769 type:complete len:444 (-) Transcript_6727:67-1398(-)
MRTSTTASDANDSTATYTSRELRKQAAKLEKRKLIEESGGIRPRAAVNSEEQGNKKSKRTKKKGVTYFEKGGQGKIIQEEKKHDVLQHRFGKVMSNVPCPKKPRTHTVSIALPGSIVDNCQTKELKTCLVGQIARAAAIYHIDEIVVFNDHLGTSKNDSCNFMAKILQYCECPQYLRKHFFPMDTDLQYVGVLSPLDAPHHVRVKERSKYREGVVLDKVGPHGGSCVNVGIGEKTKTVEFMDKFVLTAGIRCTVQMFDSNNTASKVYDSRHTQVKVVSPKAPTLEDGTYWGYQVRIADSIQQVFDDCPYEGGKYDLKVGTSERGDDVSHALNNDKKKLPRFQHMIMVFGGIAGIEECIDADESISIPGSQTRTLFDLWLNTCPHQGSRTIRTEEAVLISLARLRPFIEQNVAPAVSQSSVVVASEDIQFSDDASDESDDDANE